MSDLGVARGTVIVNVSPALASLAALRTSTAASVGALNQVGRSALNAGIGFVGFGAIIVAGFALAVNKTAELEKRMSYIKGITGLTTAQMEGLRQKTIDLGQSSAYTALEVADGFTELAKAGATTDQMIGGMGDAMITMGQASDIGLDKAATTLVSISSIFNLAANQSAHIADVIQGAANMSIISVEDMTISMKYAGGVAANLGLSLEDTATAIALLGNAGIRGSQAGTSLRRIFLQLTPRTKKAAEEMKNLGIITKNGANEFYTAEGKAKSLSTITEILRQKTMKLTPEMRQKALATMFGDRAINSAIALSKGGSAAFDKMYKSIGNVSAASVAAERLNNLAGAWEILKGSVDSFLMKVGTPAQEPLKQLVQTITKVVVWLTNLSDATQKWIVKSLLAVAALSLFTGGFLLVAGTMMRVRAIFLELQVAIAAIRIAFAGSAIGAQIAAGGLVSLLSPIVLIVAAVVALIAIFVYFFVSAYKNSAPLRKALSDMGNTLMTGLKPAIDWVKAAWKGLQDSFKSFTTGTGNAVATWVTGFADGLVSLIDGFNGVISFKGGFLGFMGEIGSTVKTVFDAVRTAVAGLVGGFQGVEHGTAGIKGVFNNLGEIAGNAFRVVRAAIFGLIDGFNGINASTSGVRGFFNQLASFLRNTVVTAFNWVKIAIFGLIDGFLGLNAKTEGVRGFFNSMGQAAKAFGDWVVGAFTNVKNAVTGFFSGLVGGSAPLTGLMGTFQTLGGIVRDVVVPFFQEFGRIITQEIWPAIQQAWSAIGTQLSPILGQLGALIQTQVWPALQQFWQMLVTLWVAIQPVIKVLAIIAGVIIGVVVVAFLLIIAVILKVLPLIINLGVAIFTMVMNVVMPVISVLVAIFTGAIQIITGLVNFFIGLFTMNWSLMWAGIVQMATGAWTAIAGIFTGAWNAIWAIVSGLVSGIVGFFTNLWNILVGHSIIPDMINAIISWFARLPGAVLGFIGGLVSSVIGWFVSMASQGIAKISEFVSGVIAWFAGLPGKAASALSTLVGKVLSFASGLLGAGQTLGQNIVDGITGILSGLGGLVSSAISGAIGNLSSFVGTAWDSAKSVGKSLWEGFKNGMGIKSPSYIEKAMYQVTETMGNELKTLVRNVNMVNYQVTKLPNAGVASQMISLNGLSNRLTIPPAPAARISTVSLRSLIDSERASASASPLAPISQATPLIGGDLVLQAAANQSVDSQFDSVMFRLKTMKGVG